MEEIKPSEGDFDSVIEFEGQSESNNVQIIESSKVPHLKKLK
jgi:hypothetical protein